MKSAATPAVIAGSGPWIPNGAARGASAEGGPQDRPDGSHRHQPRRKRELMGLRDRRCHRREDTSCTALSMARSKSLRDLLKVKGIGKKKLEHIAPLLLRGEIRMFGRYVAGLELCGGHPPHGGPAVEKGRRSSRHLSEEKVGDRAGARFLRDVFHPRIRLFGKSVRNFHRRR